MYRESSVLRDGKALRFAEWSASVLVSGVLIFVHLRLFLSTGPLWRDEINSVNVASERLSRLPELLQFDSYPAGFFLILKGWLLFARSDLAIRGLGLFVGLALLGSLWWCSYRLTSRPPLLALALAASSATIVRYGDAIRGAGAGAVLAVILVLAVWTDVKHASRRSYAVAVVAACVAMQVAYLNVIVVFAVVIGAVVVACARRSERAILRYLSIGIVAAATLLPYLPVFHGARTWNAILQLRFTPTEMVRAWVRAVSQGPQNLPFFWLLTLLVAILGVVRFDRARGQRREVQIYTAAVAIAGTVGCAGVLTLLRYPMLPWYFVSWITLVALCIDIFVASEEAWIPGARLALALAIAMAALPSTFVAASQRVTNVDVVARLISRTAKANDRVVVYPFVCGITFARYYHGVAEWQTYPPIGDSSVHRFDLFTERRDDQRWLEPYLADVKRVLANGGTVWLVSLATPPGAPIEKSTVYDDLDAKILQRFNTTLAEIGIADGPPEFVSSAAGGAYELVWLQRWKGRQSPAGYPQPE